MVITYNHAIRVKRDAYDAYANGEITTLKIERTKESPDVFRGDVITIYTGYVNKSSMDMEVKGVEYVYENEKYYFVIHLRKI